jgi:sec-independent protein translocase protein TatA
MLSKFKDSTHTIRAYKRKEVKRMGISLSELLVLLLIVIVLFGTHRLRNVGSDLGAAIKGFRNAVKEHDKQTLTDEEKKPIDGEVIAKKQEKT